MLAAQEKRTGGIYQHSVIGSLRFFDRLAVRQTVAHTGTYSGLVWNLSNGWEG